MIELQRKFYDYAEKCHVNGAALSVVTDQISKEFVYGHGGTDENQKITEQSVFQLASITKTITALGVIKLAKENKIQLEDAVSVHLGKYGLDSERWQRITVRQLLSHTAGMKHIYFHPAKKVVDTPAIELIRPYLNKMFRDNNEFLYTGIDYLLLQCIVEEASNQRFESYMLSILKDLDMVQSFYSRKKGIIGPQIPYIYQESGATGLYASARDMSSFLRHIQNIYGKQETFCNEALDMELFKRVSRPVPYGLGIATANIGGYKIYFHTGLNAGAYCMYFFIPKKNFGCSILTNHIRGGNLIYALILDYLNDNIKKVSKAEMKRYFDLQYLNCIQVMILNQIMK